MSRHKDDLPFLFSVAIRLLLYVLGKSKSDQGLWFRASSPVRTDVKARVALLRPSEDVTHTCMMTEHPLVTCISLPTMLVTARVLSLGRQESVSGSVVSDSLRPHELQPTRLLWPWNSPGKNTGVGSHCLL